MAMIGQMVMNILESPMLTESAIKASKSLLSKDFRKQLEKLPPSIQTIAQQKYLRWRSIIELSILKTNSKVFSPWKSLG